MLAQTAVESSSQLVTVASGAAEARRLRHEPMLEVVPDLPTWPALRPVPRPVAQLAEALQGLKRIVARLGRQARESGAASPALVERLRADFLGFCTIFNEVVGDASPLPQDLRDELARAVAREVLPLVHLSQSAERWYSKPRGYAGDFLTLEWVYRDEPAGDDAVAVALDRCFLDVPAAVAVRNRRGLLVEEIRATIAATGDRQVGITSLACGPAAEIFDVCAGLADVSRIAATLIDIDTEALAFVAERTGSQVRAPGRLELIHANLVHLATGRRRVDVPPQDLVYSIGLIDYFSDRWVIALLDYVHGLLRPGGRVILGNFHPRNPSKALMDRVLDWKLIHRTEDDMNRLYAASKFGRPCTRIRFEEQGINLFAECIK